MIKDELLSLNQKGDRALQSITKILRFPSFLFYSILLSGSSFGFLGCTIIGDTKKGIGGFEKTELSKLGKFSPRTGFSVNGRIQIIRVQDENMRGTSTRVFLELSSDFLVQTQAPTTNSLSLFLSAGNNLMSSHFQMPSLRSLRGYQRYSLDDPSEITKIDMGLYSHLLLHSTGQNQTVGDAMIGDIPSANTSIFMAPFQNTTHSLMGTMDLVLKSKTEYVVKFNSGFSTGNGPGVYVYLIQDGLSPIASDIELGPLQALSGAQEYAVPARLNIFPFSYVLVHCRPANVHFGRAALRTIP